MIFGMNHEGGRPCWMLSNPLDSGEAPVAPLRVINPQQWRVEQPCWQSEKKKRSRLTSEEKRGKERGRTRTEEVARSAAFPNWI